MKRVVLLVSLVVALGLLSGTALARGNDWGNVPPHGHVMLIGVEVDAGMVTFDRCVELAAGDPLSVPAHHHSVHEGAASGSPFVQGALFRAGNWIVPLNPFAGLPFTGCENFTGPFPLP